MEKSLMDHFKVFIDPSVNIPYSSYYIQGLYDVFGKKNVKFSAKYFAELDSRNEPWSFDSYMPIVFLKENKAWKVIIDFGDDIPVRKNAYQWCDLYSKINYYPDKTGEYSKVISIPPSFGIKIWNLGELISNCISNLLKLKFRAHTSLSNYFRLYFSQLKALSISEYQQNKTSSEAKNYVYFVSSLWPHQNCLEGTNLYRKVYMETCKDSGVDFEGGFLVLNDDHPQIVDFKDLIYHQRYPLKEYIAKTKKSALVFNTPAVHQCHGWKLGQFFAMGKAIISTPLQNNLPFELVHGKNIHFVNDENELKEGITKILEDSAYRNHLEQGAAEYYEKYASPSSVIKSIVNKLKTCNLAK